MNNLNYQTSCPSCYDQWDDILIEAFAALDDPADIIDMQCPFCSKSYQFKISFFTKIIGSG